MTTDVIEVTFGDGIVHEVEIAFTDLAGLSKNHPSLIGRDEPDQHPQSAITGLEDALDSKADLVGGKVPADQLPDSAMEYKGDWDASINDPPLANGSGNLGDYYYISQTGTVDLGAGPEEFEEGWNIVYNGAIWRPDRGGDGSTGSVLFEFDFSAEFPLVSSIFVKNGYRVTCVEIIIENAFNVGSLLFSHGDDPDYTEICRLDSSETGVEGTYLLYPGIKLPYDGYFDISMSQAPSSGRGTALIVFSLPDVTGSSSTGKTTDAIVIPNLIIPPATPSAHASSHVDGSDQIPTATASNRGLMDSLDKSKLDGIEPESTGDLTGAEIKSLYEAEPDTNAFTDAEKAKLAYQSGINTGDQDLSPYALIGHESSHVTGGAAKIRDATPAQDGLMTAAYADKLENDVEPAIPAGTEFQYLDGLKNWVSFGSKTRSILLTGIDLVTSGVVTAASSILEAFGFLQVWQTNHLAASDPHPQYVLDGNGELDANTVIYVESYNKADGSTVFTDLSTYGHTVTPFGQFQHTTQRTPAPLAGASSIMLGDGGADGLIVPNHADFNLIKTFDFYFSPDLNNTMGLFSMWDTGEKRIAIEFRNSDFRVLFSNDGSTSNTWLVSHTITAGDMVFLRVVLYDSGGGAIRAALSVNGLVLATYPCGTLYTSASDLRIAAYSTVSYLDGTMEIFRGTNNETSADQNFTPPTEKYSYGYSEEIELNSSHRRDLSDIPHDIGAKIQNHALTNVHSGLSAPDGDPYGVLNVTNGGYVGINRATDAECALDVNGEVRVDGPSYYAALRVAGGDYNRIVLRVGDDGGLGNSGKYGFSFLYAGAFSGNSNAFLLKSDNQTGPSVTAQWTVQDGKTGFNTESEPSARVQIRPAETFGGGADNESALLIQDHSAASLLEISDVLGTKIYSGLSTPSSQTIVSDVTVGSGIINVNVDTTSSDVDITLNPANTEQGNHHYIDHVAGTNTLTVVSTVNGTPNQIIPLGSCMHVVSTLVNGSWVWRQR